MQQCWASSTNVDLSWTKETKVRTLRRIESYGQTSCLPAASEDQTTFTVVSGGADEGKTTTMFNLAVVFAQMGDRILVIDSDLRRPSMHRYFKVSNTIGLTNLLLGQNTRDEVIQTTESPNLHFIPSGKLPSSSMGVLNSAKMKEFVAEMKSRYDYVFFDAPPIMGVSDASVLASAVDLCVLVVQYRKYPQLMTQRAKDMVIKVGGNLVGVVLNNINISQDSYYYYTAATTTTTIESRNRRGTGRGQGWQGRKTDRSGAAGEDVNPVLMSQNGFVGWNDKKV